MSQSFGSTFFEVFMIGNPTIAVGISTLSIIVPQIWVFPVWEAVLPFPVVGRWHNHHLVALWTRQGWKPQNYSWNFDAIYHSSRDISISVLGGRIAISGCRSLLQSFGGTFFELVVVENPQNCRWNLTLSIIVPELYNYFQFGWPYCYFRLSVVLTITLFELENPIVQLETTNLLFFYLNSWGLFYPNRNTCE